MVGEHPAGDHVLALGKVIDGRLLDSKAEPMAYRETGAMDGASALFPDVFGDCDAAAPRFSQSHRVDDRKKRNNPAIERCWI